MGVFLRKQKLLFLAQARTGSNSVREALLDIGGKDIGSHHYVPMDLAKRKDTVVFFTIRNHFDMLVTSYIKITWQRQLKVSFKEWVRQCLTNPNCTEEYKPDGAITNICFNGHSKQMYSGLASISNVILKFESLESDLNNLLEVHGAPLIKLKWLNSTPHKRPYQKYYTNGIKDLVQERFDEELELYGYTFDNGLKWVPRDDSLLLNHGSLDRKNWIAEDVNCVRWPNVEPNKK